MDKIKELVNDIAECFDGHGIPNLDYLEDRINELKKLVNKTNDIHDVSGFFTADDMEEAYNDGAGINTPREFNINNYR